MTRKEHVGTECHPEGKMKDKKMNACLIPSAAAAAKNTHSDSINANTAEPSANDHHRMIMYFYRKCQSPPRPNACKETCTYQVMSPGKTWQLPPSPAKLSLRKQTGRVTSWVRLSADRLYQGNREASASSEHPPLP
ncbi:epithelial cell-transforming sequence 2 oncogene-like [Platysternon megacephalum]|uniref:Epithelial cell-transforming sequence 2 oncogene-like n=1 Tax=Platysternon megacephalum TaxID=55544 RepID=A0A4D9EVL7_9SAUR|nr:epithelial cell-transforming sequence 2 oncogene-like [Platysternon megacephalum]